MGTHPHPVLQSCGYTLCVDKKKLKRYENKETISAENAVIIAAPDLDDMSEEAGAPVFGKWAAGKLKKDLPPNNSVKIEHALEKPQFDIGLIEFSQSDLGIYVIETK